MPPGMLPGVPPGVPPGMPPGIPPGVPPGVLPGMPPGMPPGVRPGVRPGMPPGVPPGVPPGMPPGMPPGVPPGVHPGMPRKYCWRQGHSNNIFKNAPTKLVWRDHNSFMFFVFSIVFVFVRLLTHASSITETLQNKMQIKDNTKRAVGLNMLS